MRHDRVFLHPSGWDAALRCDPTLDAIPEVGRWIAAGWPLVRRRRLPGEPADIVPLGLPLPPGAARRRVGLQVSAEDVREVRPALDLATARKAAPSSWQASLDAVASVPQCQPARVFGSLAWTAITGLDYLTPGSDLDLMVAVQPPDRPAAWIDGLDAAARMAPMRLDAEFVRPDGATLSWREARGAEALVKHEGGVALMAPAAFWAGDAP